MAKKGIKPSNFEEFQKKAWHYNTGRKASLETRKKMSESHKGKLVGRKLTDEHRKKLSEKRKAFYANGGVHPRGALGRVHSDETKKKMSEAHKGEKNYNWKGGYENKLFHNRLRGARKKGATGSHSFEEWNDLKKLYNYMCLCCKQQEPFVKLTEDHIVPISRGGSNDISNIQPLCQSCNSLKWTKIIDYRATQPTYAGQ